METKRYSFKDLLSVVIDNRGKSCPTSEVGFPLIATNCIKMDSLYPVFEKVRYISKDTYENWFRGHPEPEDIIFVCKGSPGRVALTPNPVNFCIAQDMLAIRANEEIINQRFLFALLRSKETETKILNMHVGTLIPHFKKGDFGNLYFDIPTDKSIQKKIGEIYYKMSAKIELNRQMNQTLEAMAQALFKSWFVDFDPVMDNLLAAGNPIPDELEAMAEKRRSFLAKGDVIANPDEGGVKQSHQTTSKRLIDTNPELAAKFPSTFVFNEVLGKWIPEGWEVKTIGDITDKVTDGTHSTVKDDPDGNCFLLSCKNIKNGQILITENDRKINLQTLQQLRKRTGLQVNDVLLTTVGTIGEVALVTKDPNNYELQRSVAIIRGDYSKVLHHFLHHYIKSRFFQNEALNRSKGSVQTCLFLGAINSVPTLIPTFNLIESFQNTIESYQLKIGFNQEQIETLTQLRDRLLPELISGRVRVHSII